MKRYIVLLLFSVGVLTSCGEYNKVLKSTNSEFKYETAKAYFAEGKYSKAATLLEELVPILKGQVNGEESLYMLAMNYFNQGDYVTASQYFNTYYTTYPRGLYTELARYFSGRALYLDTPEPRLDQSSTYKAIKELQMFMEYFPGSVRQKEAQNMIFELQDKLVEKEYLSAKLYYDLGPYTGNSSMTSTGNNYLAAIITAQNTLRDYPYTKLREDLSILILKAKYDLAKESVIEKKQERMQDALDEYYAFKNEFPDSKFMPQANKIFADVNKFVNVESDNTNIDNN